MDSGLPERVLGATDVVAVVGRAVALKRRGLRYVGPCPFHQGGGPSFHVSPERQTFRCSECGAGGNAIDYVMRRDRLSFAEAVRTLARASGIE